ncbi:redox-sensing transcriptional repressor Rex [Enemella dayhoffiae]|uniref:Redox-sensing transcriptional repressor Rex n=1 Tax=Enemella dayhoffiae TaxID=2016507 RepID=A0A255H7T8_9ACTN|nr:redox-sensing transcriptional repressor Rex [Enemella dayhoffiae]
MPVEPARGRGGIPEATVSRLATYLGVLNNLASAGVATVSSGELAATAGVNPAQLRKDLSHLGSYGIRGVGYDVAYLRFQLDQNIGSAEHWPVIIVGVGNLGRALVNHAGFSSRGFRVSALFDVDPALVGSRVEGLPIHHLSDLASVVRDPLVTIGVLTVPGEHAQPVADTLVDAGIKCLLNFAPINLAVPAQVTVRKVDLGSELQILAYHRQMSLADAISAEGLVPGGYGHSGE